MDFTVEFTPSASRDLLRIEGKAPARIESAIDKLASNPRPRGCRKLAGEEHVWRIRVGDFRILYEVHDARLVVLVVRVGNRKDVCRD